MAVGVLPLVLGRATRLARLLSGSDKEYTATVELGLATDTRDLSGRPLGPRWHGPMPESSVIEAALERFRGTFLQQPPAFSAKKINGRRSYDIARAQGGVLPPPAAVTAHVIEILDATGPLLTLRLRCSPGFYVRSLAHDLGEALGTGAHLQALRRTEAAGVRIERAVPLATLQQGGAPAADAVLVPLDQMVPWLPAVALTCNGVAHAKYGRNLEPSDATHGFPLGSQSSVGERFVRLLDQDGRLVGLAQPASTPGLLHPAVILI
jgi:tRNA pseudouridine55 synthase